MAKFVPQLRLDETRNYSVDSDLLGSEFIRQSRSDGDDPAVEGTADGSPLLWTNARRARG